MVTLCATILLIILRLMIINFFVKVILECVKLVAGKLSLLFWLLIGWMADDGKFKVEIF